MIVFAVNIHSGGGKVLLDELISSEPFGKITHLYLDRRYQNNSIPSTVETLSYPPTIKARLQAQWDLRKMFKVNPGLKKGPVLFFGNLPPFFKLRVESILYLQNCFNLSGISLPKASLKENLRNRMERYLLKIFSKNYQKIWVQSDWMVQLAKNNFPEKEIYKKPFIPALPEPTQVEKIYDFISVTSLSSHKNLRLLLQAFELLDLKVTSQVRALIVLDNSVNITEVRLPKLKHIHLTLRSKLSRQDLFLEYQRSKIAVITSLLESFCLPIFEALHFGLKVICPAVGYTLELKNETLQYNVDSAKDLSELLEQNLRASSKKIVSSADGKC